MGEGRASGVEGIRDERESGGAIMDRGFETRCAPIGIKEAIAEIYRRAESVLSETMKPARIYGSDPLTERVVYLRAGSSIVNVFPETVLERPELDRR